MRRAKFVCDNAMVGMRFVEKLGIDIRHYGIINSYSCMHGLRDCDIIILNDSKNIQIKMKDHFIFSHLHLHDCRLWTEDGEEFDYEC